MKNEIVSLFDKVKPIRSDDEILKGVLRKAEAMKNKKTKGKINKPIAAVCAVIAAATIGVTGAAAAGIIRFDKTFGRQIRAESEELGEELISVNEDFRYNVSNDNYTIELKGVTGSSSEIIANLEFKRVDGKPVIDDFINEYKQEENISSVDSVKCVDMVGYNQYSINESGNIDIDLNFCAISPISGEVLTANGFGFYPSETFLNYIIDNNIPIESVAETDTNSIIYLPVEWSFSFRYFPTEKALIEIEAKELNTIVNLNATTYTDDSEEDFTSEFTLDKIKLTATRGYLTLTSEASDYISYGITADNKNDIRFIRKDGTEVLAFIAYSSTSANGNVECGILYSSEPLTFDENGYVMPKIIAADISEIEAVEINGQIITL